MELLYKITSNCILPMKVKRQFTLRTRHNIKNHTINNKICLKDCKMIYNDVIKIKSWTVKINQHELVITYKFKFFQLENMVMSVEKG